MPSLNSQRQSNRAISRSEIIGTLLVQVLVLLALLVAVVRYLEWSSDANQAEFAGATKPSLASGSNHLPEVSIPIRTVRGRAGCNPKAQ